VFANSCALNSVILLMADADIASIRGPFDMHTVANDHAMLETSCGENRSRWIIWTAADALASINGSSRHFNFATAHTMLASSAGPNSRMRALAAAAIAASKWLSRQRWRAKAQAVCLSSCGRNLANSVTFGARH